MKNLITIFSFFILCACTSQSLEQAKYYVLNASPPDSTRDAQKPSSNIVLVDRIVVADYLEKSNIVLQLSSNELYFSARHLWAEPLKRGIAKGLSGSYDNMTIVATSASSTSSDTALNLVIDYFHIVDAKEVVLAGSYILNKAGDTVIREPVYFDIRKPLAESGYPYAVSLMSESLRDLGQNISTSL